MEAITKLIILINGQKLISSIEEVVSDIGEPDCKLIKPFVIKKEQGFDEILEPFLSGYTNQQTFMMSSDKILTLADPKPTLLEKYQNLTK